MRRVVNRLLAVIFGLAVIALAVVVIVEVIAQRAGADPVLVDWPSAYAWAQRTAWNNGMVLGISVLVGVVGLALVIGQLWPSRIRRLPVDSPDSATDAAITRRGLARDVSAAVGGLEDVKPEHVTVGRRRITVRAATKGTAEPDALRDAVTASVRDRLDRLHLRRPPELVVNISRRS